MAKFINENPLVSVLMTSFNREKYIGEAIESVLNSTYSNLELIIVDDCSKDQTVEIIFNYKLKDNRVKVYINETNLGDYLNRNKAASFAKGKYLKYVDSDDIIYPHCLNVMVDSMEKFPEAGIGFDYYGYDGHNYFPYFFKSNDILNKHFFHGGCLSVGPLGSIYLRDFFLEIGGFDPSFGVASDSEFNLRAASKRPVVLFQRDLYWYRRHEAQEFNIRKNEYEVQIFPELSTNTAFGPASCALVAAPPSPA